MGHFLYISLTAVHAAGVIIFATYLYPNLKHDEINENNWIFSALPLYRCPLPAKKKTVSQRELRGDWVRACHGLSY